MRALLAHLMGDYVFQNDHMAREKVRAPESPGGAAAAAAHALAYTVCHVPLTRDVRALAVIGGTHYVIDRYRLAKRLVWARNQAAPAASRYPWADAGVFGERQVRETRTEVRMPEPNGDGSINLLHYQEREVEVLVPASPPWLDGWVMILADNTVHLAINQWALRRWAT